MYYFFMMKTTYLGVLLEPHPFRYLIPRARLAGLSLGQAWAALQVLGLPS